MIKYETLKRREGLFKSFTGLSQPAFETLLKAFEGAYTADLAQQDEQRQTARQRQRGGGRHSYVETCADKLVFILVYFRFYPVQVLQGYLFGMGQSQANEWIHRLTPLLNQALGTEQHLPARQTKDIKTLLAACPELAFIIDGTERPIRRPKAPERQRRYYSGKRKRHTVKNTLLTEKATRKIKALSATCEGKQHDKKVADEHGIEFPPDSSLWKDTGFQGYEPANTHTFQPKKKPKGRDLSPEDKATNTAISRQRIGVEHSIGGVKVFTIVRDVFRNFKAGFDDLVMETACGLHNLRIDYPLAP